MKKVGIFLPGRLSSQRLPNKLILPIGNTCLWEIACYKLNALPKDIEKVVLIQDEELINIAKKYENIKIIKRSEESAKAEGPLKFIFKDIEKMKSTHLIFLNPCLLFLKNQTILNFIKMFETIPLDYATSVKPFQNWLLDGQAKALNEINFERLTTKEIKPVWQAAHCFHAFPKDQFLKDGMMLKPELLIFPVPDEETIDVDTKKDYLVAKALWEAK